MSKPCMFEAHLTHLHRTRGIFQGREDEALAQAQRKWLVAQQARVVDHFAIVYTRLDVHDGLRSTKKFYRLDIRHTVVQYKNEISQRQMRFSVGWVPSHSVQWTTN